jgi:hypothetical protein
MSASALLSRLEGVREVAPRRWIARCPAHEDRNPSLAIQETDGGKILIFCHAGCGAADVLSAVGLDFSDLYPASRGFDSAARHSAPRRLDANLALHSFGHEIYTVAIIVEDFRQKCQECQKCVEQIRSRLDLSLFRTNRLLRAIGLPPLTSKMKVGRGVQHG